MLCRKKFLFAMIVSSFIPLFLLACHKAPLSPKAKALLNQLESQGDLIVAKKIDGALPLEPNDGAWKDAQEVKIPTVSQSSVIPRSTEFKRTELSAKALYNKKELGLLLSWKDPTKDEKVSGAQYFQDAVAVGFPIQFGTGNPLPYIGMGNAGRPVNIWQWNAAWQADLDQGYQGVAAAHPGMVPDVGSMLYRTAESAGSPLSQEKRKSSVGNLLAEGFGSLTPSEAKDLAGKGVWQDGRWSVVIKRPLKVGREEGVYLYQRDQGLIPAAFAIWDGEGKERNGIKEITRWRFIHLEGEAVPLAYLQSFVIGPLEGANKDHGKQLLTDLGCIACHAFPGNAPVIGIGPDLTHAGAIHRPEYLKESIQDPNTVVVLAPGYYDPKTKTSLMPVFGEAINPKDLNDMVEYLRSLQ